MPYAQAPTPLDLLVFTFGQNIKFLKGATVSLHKEPILATTSIRGPIPKTMHARSYSVNAESMGLYHRGVGAPHQSDPFGILSMRAAGPTISSGAFETTTL